MYPPYPPYPPPAAGPALPVPRMIAAAGGGVALLGFLVTLLPVFTIRTSARNPFLLQFDPEQLGGDGGGDGGIDVAFGYYDWIAATYPAVGLIPIALAVAAAAGLLQAVRGTDRAAQAVTVFLGLAAVVVTTLTAIRPAAAVHVTGELGRKIGGEPDIGGDVNGLDVAPSVIITAITLVVVVGLNAWQLLANRAQAPG